MKAKTVFDGEWVKVRPLMNRRFGVGVDPACEKCRKMSCGSAWYSIRTRRYRCSNCFKPRGL